MADATFAGIPSVGIKMGIPTQADLDPYDSLDGQYAVEHFLGKTLQEAEDMFGSDSNVVYQEDLLWMGPVAFRYYIHAAISYIRTEAASRDVYFLECIAVVVEHRVDCEPREMVPIAPVLVSLCDSVIGHCDKLQTMSEEYASLRREYALLREHVQRLPAESLSE